MANTPKMKAEARAICNGCKFKDVKRMKCGACGCPLNAKINMLHCPKGFFNKKGTGTKQGK